jgi:hypothetical protein
MTLAQITLTDERPQVAWLLGVAGTLPLWICAVLAWSHSDPVGTHRAVAISIAYSAVALGFLGGTRWGSAIVAGERLDFLRERLCAIAPGLAGLAAMFLPPVVSLTLIVSMFLWQALWDLTSAEDGRLPYWSGMLRVALTAITVPALLALLARLLLG